MLSSKVFLQSQTVPSHLILIILNYTLPRSTPFFWRRASVRICADGGANRIYDKAPSWTSQQEPLSARKHFLPDVITGDLDSIRPDVASFYSQQGIQIVDLSEDQDSSDLHKCLVNAEMHLEQKSIPLHEATILAVGAFGGRLDHTLSNINILYTHQHLNIVLCGDGSLARLVPRGRTIIQPDLTAEGPDCGVIALGQPAIASSTGLKWNLDKHELAVGGLMSSSNKIVAEEIMVESSGPVIWISQFKDKL